jgi:predicted secreted hydrolase
VSSEHRGGMTAGRVGLVAAIVVAAVAFGDTTARGAAGGFTEARAPYVFRFPRDHFAHDDYRTEWWYFTGHLRSNDGERFGFEVTFFRFGLRPRPYRVRPGRSAWYASQLYAAHLAITDVARNRFVFREKQARDALGQGYASQRRFLVRVGSWSLEGTDAADPAMRLVASAGGEGVMLRAVASAPPVVNGRGGISRKGPCASCASHYYSYRRLRLDGTIVLDGRRIAVRGIGWMDHEYGSDELPPDEVGWDWFAIQLRDGRSIMYYRLRDRSGRTVPQSSGTLVDARGHSRVLSVDDVRVRALGSWRSPHDGAVYPSGWSVTVHGLRRTLRIVPLVRDQELYGPALPAYWEGDCGVYDAANGVRLGDAYVELTGYAAPLRF